LKVCGVLPIIGRGDKGVVGAISGVSSLFQSQEGNGFEQSVVILAGVLADEQVSDNQDGTLTKQSIFSLVGGYAKSFAGHNVFEFSVLVKGDLVVGMVGQDLDESGLFSVVAFHLLTGIVVREGGIQESKVSESDQESRGDNVFGISSIVDQSVFFFQSVTGLNNSV
jgi:hypothetical protein